LPLGQNVCEPVNGGDRAGFFGTVVLIINHQDEVIDQAGNFGVIERVVIGRQVDGNLKPGGLQGGAQFGQKLQQQWLAMIEDVFKIDADALQLVGLGRTEQLL